MSSTRRDQNTFQIAREADGKAREIRLCARYDYEQVVDARELASRMGFRVLMGDDLVQQPSTSSQGGPVSALSAKEWSAFLIPDIKTIVVNPNQTPERMQASIMEEVAHDFLGHQPSQIKFNDCGGVTRTRDDESETSAYWTGAAVLLPGSWIAKSIWKGVSIEAMAAERGVSQELTEFRVKTLGLWNRSARE